MCTISIMEPPVRNGGMADEQLAAAVQHADAGRAEHLVAGEHREVDAQRAEVDRRVRHRLAGVQHGQRADLAGPRDQPRGRVDRAEHVGLVGERDDLGVVVDQFVDVRQIEPAVVGDAEPAQRRAGALGDLLPRHQVRVVLHLGHDDLVAGAEPEALGLRARRGRVAHRVGDQVDALGGVLGEHQLVGAHADERRRSARARPRRRRWPPRPAGARRGARRRWTSPGTPARRPAPACGRWDVAPESRYTNRLPSRTVRPRIGKSLRSASTSSGSAVVSVTVVTCHGLLALPAGVADVALVLQDRRPVPGRRTRRSGRRRTRARSPG